MRRQAALGQNNMSKALNTGAQSSRPAGRCQQNPLLPPARACLTGRVKADLGIWNWLTHAVIALVAVAVLVFIGLAYLDPIRQNERMRKEIYRLDAEIQKQDATARELRAEIEALRNDPATVARLAREKLGYAKPDETVVRFDTNAPAR